MHATTNSRRVANTPPATPASMDGIRTRIASLLLDAAAFVSPMKVEETARGWLARSDPRPAEPGRDVLLVAEALALATDLALFTPSTSGQTALTEWLVSVPARPRTRWRRSRH